MGISAMEFFFFWRSETSLVRIPVLRGKQIWQSDAREKYNGKKEINLLQILFSSFVTKNDPLEPVVGYKEAQIYLAIYMELLYMNKLTLSVRDRAVWFLLEFSFILVFTFSGCFLSSFFCLSRPTQATSPKISYPCLKSLLSSGLKRFFYSEVSWALVQPVISLFLDF